MKKQLLFVLLALCLSAGHLMCGEPISAQTQRPTVEDPQVTGEAPASPARTKIAAPQDFRGDSIPKAANRRSRRDRTAEPAQLTSGSPAPPSATAVHVQHVVDYDADGKTDFAVVRDLSGGDPSVQAEWWISLSTTGNTKSPVPKFGLPAAPDQFLAGDYDGDHKTDLVIWRGTFNGDHPTFWILRSSDSTVAVYDFGLDGDSPFVVGDYDGDGKDDIAVYRSDPDPVNHTLPAEWWFHPSSDTTPGFLKEVRVQWGTQFKDDTLPGDIPTPGDYDFDGKADFAVAKDNGNGTTTMWILFGDGTSNPGSARPPERWGLTSDFFIPGDYDGDGKTDYAIVRVNDAHTNLEWWVKWSSDGSIHITPRWGEPGDLRYVVQGDYDGDGKTDIAIWRPAEAQYYIVGSLTGAPIYKQWGTPGVLGPDFPIANFNEQ
jgi:hypothetical protein